MGKTNSFRPETLVIRSLSIVPAASTDYTVNLPAGSYHILIVLNANVTGGTTVLDTIVKYGDSGQTVVSAIDLQILEEDDAAFITAITLAAGISVRMVRVFDITGAADTGISPLVIPHGFQFSVTKGGATTGEKLEIEVIATRVT
jgi:hypothetical protein